MKKVRNITSLRDSLITLYESQINGSIDKAEAKSRNDTAGKIMKAAQLELSYDKHMKKEDMIPFLEK